MRHLLARASSDTDGVRDDLPDDVVDRLGDANAVLMVDETGDVKKGSATVGVQRQCTPIWPGTSRRLCRPAPAAATCRSPPSSGGPEPQDRSAVVRRHLASCV